jgi:hypothetical protein
VLICTQEARSFAFNNTKPFEASINVLYFVVTHTYNLHRDWMTRTTDHTRLPAHTYTAPHSATTYRKTLSYIPLLYCAARRVR